MNVTVVYDSIFGNTAKVATAIAAELEHNHIVKLATVQDAREFDLADTANK